MILVGSLAENEARISTGQESRKEWISCRDVLWLMVFWGFGINYMLRNNLNLAIVTMVVPREKSVAATECGSGNSSYFDSGNTTSALQATAVEQQQQQQHGQYPWNEYQQSMALGAYYWLHWLLQLPGGLLARRYGTKMIFGLGNVLVAVLGFALPYATHYSLGALVAVRALQGLISVSTSHIINLFVILIIFMQ
ncbi:unnamed protein product [Trichogramma brassicae]|uniref:Major facilitator superfamily (MFS) profile domain-containing protein n=1 Tax=Trichogramma brassicae TaxID=86971 RepID=A0A6H5ISY3_9HYME|nr:unnamed protein product [Trichogramma brassicae]